MSSAIQSFEVALRHALGSFFRDADLVCSTEKTYHALFCHHLVLAGVPLQSIAREAWHDGAPVDVVIYDSAVRGLFQEHPTAALAAFEFKGGAYGNRNALRDTIGADGSCADMDKLGRFRARGVPAWFICIDQAELGVVLDAEARRRTAALCASRGLGFAYFCQGESTFLWGPLDVSPVTVAIGESTDGATTGRTAPVDLAALVNGVAGEMADEVQGSEDDYVFRLYHALRGAGYSSQQLSLETYFAFARREKARMQLRPDLCIFESSVAGRFNLYRGGRTTASHDALKLRALRDLIEVKGSVGGMRRPQSAFVRSLEDDLDKLRGWWTMVEKAAADLGICRAHEPRCTLVVMDPRPTPLPPHVLTSLQSRAASRRVDLLYRHLFHVGHAAPTDVRGALPQRRIPAPLVFSADLDRSVLAAADHVTGTPGSAESGIAGLRPHPAAGVPSQGARTNSIGDETDGGDRGRLYKLAKPPRSPRELATYFAAILSVTGMDRGAVFPLQRFLANFSGHVAAGRIERVEGGYRLTAAGLAAFQDRFRTAKGGALDPREVAVFVARIRSGDAAGWIPIE